MTNQYIQNLIQQYLNDEQNNEQYSLRKNISDFNKNLNNVNKIAQNTSEAGKFLNNNFTNSGVQNSGSTMTKVGNSVTNGINTFKGFATKPFEAIASKLGTGAATTGAAAGAGAGTAAGATGGAAAGSAAGGAATGGSGAGAAAAGGPIGALAALAVMALTGTNRKRAKNAGNQLLGMTNNLVASGNAESEQNLAQIQQNNAALQQQANQALSQGTITGGAAPVQTNYVQENTPSLGYEGSATQELVENRPKFGEVNAQKEGLRSKLANAFGDFWLGYQENRNNGFAPENLTSNQFAITKEVPNTQLQDYQQELANSGKYTPEQIQAVGDKKNSGYKEIDQWIKNNPQAFGPTTTETTYKDKSKMSRAGEFAGTIGRILQNPTTQALVAGTLSTALTRNPLYGLGMAYKFGNKRAMSDVYQNELAKQGVEVNPSMWGSLSTSDMNALMMPQYKQIANDILKARLDENANHHAMMMKYYYDRLNETHDNNVANQQIKKINANANVIRAKNSGNKGGNNKSQKDTKSKNYQSIADIINNAPQPKGSRDKKKVYSF